MIYFMQPVDGGPVKIGFTDDVEKRHRSLEWCYGVPLVVLATMPGGRPEEKGFHDQFAHLRIGRTEQFRPAAELMVFIGRPVLVDVNPEATERLPDRSQLGSTVRLTDEAIKWGRIASGYTGESMSEYVSRVVTERGKQDADRLHSEVSPDKSKPKTGK